MPFKSEKQRRFMWANEPHVARKWTEETRASGGMIKKAISHNMKLQDFARMRTGGMIDNGSKTPKRHGITDYQKSVCKKFGY
tara:strand:+ start:92 stop:337 length:246 start_codon:yes stop_codon:yes gene_type:complete